MAGPFWRKGAVRRGRNSPRCRAPTTWSLRCCRKSSITLASLCTSPAAHLQHARSLPAEGFLTIILKAILILIFHLQEAKWLILMHLKILLRDATMCHERGEMSSVLTVRWCPAQPGDVSESERGRERGRARRGATHVLLRLGPGRH